MIETILYRSGMQIVGLLNYADTIKERKTKNKNSYVEVFVPESGPLIVCGFYETKPRKLKVKKHRLIQF